MRGQVIRRACAVVLLLLLSACDDNNTVDSENVGTPEICADMSAVQGNSGSVTVVTQLRDRPGCLGNYLRLVGDDRLIASNGQPIDSMSYDDDLFGHAVTVSSNVVLMKERDAVMWDIGYVDVLAGEPEYYALLPDADATAGFYVTFERSVDDSASNTLITLPAPFQILSPDPGSSIPRSDPIELQWSTPPPGSSDSMWVEMGGTCDSGQTVQFSKPLSDTGSALIASSEYAAKFPTNETCAVTIALERIRYGIVADAFGYGGQTHGIERRTVTITSGP